MVLRAPLVLWLKCSSFFAQAAKPYGNFNGDDFISIPIRTILDITYTSFGHFFITKNMLYVKKNVA